VAARVPITLGGISDPQAARLIRTTVSSHSPQPGGQRKEANSPCVQVAGVLDACGCWSFSAWNHSKSCRSAMRRCGRAKWICARCYWRRHRGAAGPSAPGMARPGSTCAAAAFSIRRSTSCCRGCAWEARRRTSGPGGCPPRPEFAQRPSHGCRMAPVAHHNPARHRLDRASAIAASMRLPCRYPGADRRAADRSGQPGAARLVVVGRP
jgi:hypothetical protein